MPPNRLQKHLGAENIGPYERCRIENGAVHVAFRSEVDHDIRAVRQRPIHRFGVGNVAADELVTGIAGPIAKVFRITCVGEFIEADNRRLGIAFQNSADKVAADKATTAGDHHPEHEHPFT